MMYTKPININTIKTSSQTMTWEEMYFTHGTTQDNGLACTY